MNQIHFTDLKDGRFEDLALMLAYPLHPWEEINHDGRTGSDRGVDIRAVERLENGIRRAWLFQCRRYKSASATRLHEAVDDAIEHEQKAPDVLVVVLGCDVSLKARESYEVYAYRAGIQTPVLWPASKLEAMLYSSRQDLLFAFFGISLVRDQRARESSIRQNLVLKRRLATILKSHQAGSKVVVRSVDDETYPGDGAAMRIPSGHISSWFIVEFNRPYHGGLEFVLDGRYIVVADDGQWDELDTTGFGWNEAGTDYAFERHVDVGRFTVKRAWLVGRIPYRNIVEVDEDGDEIYPQLHLFCRFADQGRPHESICYLVDKHTYLDPESRRRLTGISPSHDAGAAGQGPIQG